MDLTHANEMLPQRLLPGFEQHRMPEALLIPRTVVMGAQGLAQAVQQLGLLAGREPFVEPVARGVT